MAVLRACPITRGVVACLLLASTLDARAAEPEPGLVSSVQLLPPTDTGPALVPQPAAHGDLTPPNGPSSRRDGALPSPAELLSPPAADNPDHSPVPSSGILEGDIASIDLPSALNLAGVQNPELLIVRQRLVETMALRQLAAAQILPNLNVGMNYDDHTGSIQQSSGQIYQLQRQALYVGAGANAVGSGTPQVPGLQYNLNVSSALFGYLSARQTIQTQQFANISTRNQVLLDVVVAYIELLRAEGRRAIALQIRSDVAEVARLTSNFARAGEGREADAQRAATELAGRNTQILAIESEVLTASARLAQLLNLDPATRLRPVEGWAVPVSLVPAAIPLSDLIGTAMLQHPNLAAHRSAIRESFLELRTQQILPFSPQVMSGFSAGGFGGGGNHPDLGAASEFGQFASRVDIEVVTYWTLQNVGLGNRALIAAAGARLDQSNFRQLEVLNQVRFDVASAYARTQARYAQLVTFEHAVRAASDAFQEDLTRIRGRAGLPIEVLNSLRLLAVARFEYLDAIIEYNRAEFDLYVALGQPPADSLAGSEVAARLPQPAAPEEEIAPAQLGTIVPVEGAAQRINLETAWRLAGVQNPTINVARQVAREAAAVQRKARLIWFPNLNAGAMYYSHVGNWQAPTGQIQNLTDQSVYFGSGAYTMGAQSNAIPGVLLSTQVSDALFEPLAARQQTVARRFDVRARNNEILLSTTRAYLELLAAEAQWEALRLSYADTQKLVQTTRAYAQTGQGRIGDADRMQAEGFLVFADLQETEGRLAIASAALAQFLQLDPSVRLRTPGAAMQTVDLVDLDLPLTNLLEIAQRRRPELGSLSAAVGEGQIRVRQEKMRPLLPGIWLGWSGGGFGGTGNYISNPAFTNVLPRTDFDAMAVWTLQNAGLGNVARIRGSRAELGEAIYQRVRMENQVRNEVTSAYAAARARRRQVDVALRRISEAEAAFQEDFRRLLGLKALPIEVLNSVRLLIRARETLINAFVNDNLAQFELFVALGLPPSAAAAQAHNLLGPTAR